tara:strand:- start:7787 stop:8566 length:780 start_codon:yes stop_codon:yes gene_type:complete
MIREAVLTDIFPEVKVVSLKKDQKRRESLMPSLEARGFEAKVFDAIGKENLDTALSRLEVKCKRKGLTVGEIGCALSHSSIYDGVPDDCNYILILEDDVIPLRDNDLRFGLGGDVERGELMLLGVSSKGEWLAAKRSKEKIRKLGVEWVQLDIFSIFFLRGTCSYLISRDTAKDILAVQRNELQVADAWWHFFKRRAIKKVFYSEFFKHPEVNASQSNLEESRMSGRRMHSRYLRKAFKVLVFWSLFSVRGFLGSKYIQ